MQMLHANKWLSTYDVHSHLLNVTLKTIVVQYKYLIEQLLVR